MFFRLHTEATRCVQIAVKNFESTKLLSLVISIRRKAHIPHYKIAKIESGKQRAQYG
jgi:hypothetical protein